MPNMAINNKESHKDIYTECYPVDISLGQLLFQEINRIEIDVPLQSQEVRVF